MSDDNRHSFVDAPDMPLDGVVAVIPTLISTGDRNESERLTREFVESFDRWLAEHHPQIERLRGADAMSAVCWTHDAMHAAAEQAISEQARNN